MQRSLSRDQRRSWQSRPGTETLARNLVDRGCPSYPARLWHSGAGRLPPSISRPKFSGSPDLEARTSGRVSTLRIDFVNWTGPAIAVQVFTTNGHRAAPP
ncbi:hypothetical protein ACIQCF_17195 [Streptomyces sp. NPDC088353]|uniref:hypothetical protein n=1 Tax=Streptomyces sp. NPDC088353 TaxID=3365855 RepID=UPI0037FB93E1